jgi:hypothetical protein
MDSPLDRTYPNDILVEGVKTQSVNGASFKATCKRFPVAPFIEAHMDATQESGRRESTG